MDKKQMVRDQNPVPEAVFAMYHWHKDYAEKGLGSMGYFDSLPKREKEYCRRAVAAIEAAKTNHT